MFQMSRMGVKHVCVGSSVIDSSSNYTIIRQMKPVLVGTHSVFSESHNWDVMVRGCSLIDPCWSALNRTLNGWLWAERESTGSRKWQQLLCWSCCQQEPWDGDVLVTHFWNKNLTIAPTMKGDGSHPTGPFEAESGASVPAARRSTRCAPRLRPDKHGAQRWRPFSVQTERTCSSQRTLAWFASMFVIIGEQRKFTGPCRQSLMIASCEVFVRS